LVSRVGGITTHTALLCSHVVCALDTYPKREHSNFHFAFELSEEHTLRQLCLAKRNEHWLRIENLQENLGKQSSSVYVEVPVAASCCHLHQEDSLVCRSDVVGEDL
jgi:predicted secreted protein